MTSTDAARKRRAAIYRRAAKRMEEMTMDHGTPQGELWRYGYACNAIQAVLGRDPLDEDAQATKVFKATFSPGWANECGFFGPMEKPGNRDRRVVALCLMAAMVEAGDA